MVTGTQMRKALRQVAAEHPDRVQPTWGGGSCAFTGPDGCASCIIGHAADVLGLTRPPWGAEENGWSVEEAFPEFGPDAAELATRVQVWADRGVTWRVAVAYGWART